MNLGAPAPLATIMPFSPTCVIMPLLVTGARLQACELSAYWILARKPRLPIGMMMLRSMGRLCALCIRRILVLVV